MFKIDTLKISKELQRVGVPPQQAEVHTHIAFEIANSILSENFSTKDDMDVLKSKNLSYEKDISQIKQDIVVLKQDVTELKQDVIILKHDVANLKKDVAEIKICLTKLTKRVDNLENLIQGMGLKLTIRLGSIMAGGLALFATIVKLHI